MNYFQVMTIKHLLEHKFIYLSLAGLWTLAIFFLCLVDFNNLPSVGISDGDKYIHFVFYFVFVILWFWYFKNITISKRKLLLKIVIAALIYGVLIEILQSRFTNSRNGDINDVFANALGAITALTAIFFYNTLFRKNV